MLSREKRIKYIGFDDRWMVLIGILVLPLAMPIVFFQANPLDDFELWSQHWVSGVGYTVIYWIINRAIIIEFRKRYPNYTDQWKRIGLQLIPTMAFTLGFSYSSCFALEWSLGNGILGALQPSTGEIVSASVTSTIFVLVVYEAIYAGSRWQQSLVESERLKKESTQAQLETLKNQVNPHFLFNSLNTLATIIPEDPQLAVEFVQKLSKVYRYILEIKKRELISLHEELECIHAYRFLLEIRFGANLQFDIEIPEERLQDSIVPLSLQLLIENAIKHNVVSTSKPLTIHMGLNKSGDLVVTNNLQKKQRVSDSTGTGLNNINSRYQLLANKQIEVITTRDHFRVVIPLIKIEHYASVDR